MQRSVILTLLGFLLAAPSAFAQNSENHIEVGVFADYFNLSRISSHINFVGVRRRGFQRAQQRADRSRDGV